MQLFHAVIFRGCSIVIAALGVNYPQWGLGLYTQSRSRFLRLRELKLHISSDSPRLVARRHWRWRVPWSWGPWLSFSEPGSTGCHLGYGRGTVGSFELYVGIDDNVVQKLSAWDTVVSEAEETLSEVEVHPSVWIRGSPSPSQPTFPPHWPPPTGTACSWGFLHSLPFIINTNQNQLPS